ncbi:hypothetical protein EVG20_g3089 [Dentipellis fragilis]|uniref:Uncharacterized protein n=1 Tax=Dentipellis fragilis TaxID=205917 RepID=A0A4Y9Z899_9AGAM|nr:hypothetical protein EVG20_g3089 [Dentipellis fragilis]
MDTSPPSLALVARMSGNARLLGCLVFFIYYLTLLSPWILAISVAYYPLWDRSQIEQILGDATVVHRKPDVGFRGLFEDVYYVDRDYYTCFSTFRPWFRSLIFYSGIFVGTVSEPCVFKPLRNDHVASLCNWYHECFVKPMIQGDDIPSLVDVMLEILWECISRVCQYAMARRNQNVQAQPAMAGTTRTSMFQNRRHPIIPPAPLEMKPEEELVPTMIAGRIAYARQPIRPTIILDLSPSPPPAMATERIDHFRRSAPGKVQPPWLRPARAEPKPVRVEPRSISQYRMSSTGFKSSMPPVHVKEDLRRSRLEKSAAQLAELKRGLPTSLPDPESTPFDDSAWWGYEELNAGAADWEDSLNTASPVDHEAALALERALRENLYALLADGRVQWAQSLAGSPPPGFDVEDPQNEQVVPEPEEDDAPEDEEAESEDEEPESEDEADPEDEVDPEAEYEFEETDHTSDLDEEEELEYGVEGDEEDALEYETDPEGFYEEGDEDTDGGEEPIANGAPDSEGTNGGGNVASNPDAGEEPEFIDEDIIMEDAEPFVFDAQGHAVQNEAAGGWNWSTGQPFEPIPAWPTYGPATWGAGWTTAPTTSQWQTGPVVYEEEPMEWDVGY